MKERVWTRGMKALALALALMMTLAACGGGDDAGGAEGEGEEAAPEATEAAPTDAATPAEGGGTEATTAAAGCEATDTDYPTQDITLIIGRSAGGGHDEFGRAYASQLEEVLGTTVVVENMPGAGGVVASDFMLEAAPDGHTIHLMDPVGLIGYYTATDPEFNYADDFTHDIVGTVSARPTTFAVPADGDIQNWDDFVARAESDEPLLFAHSGAGSTNFLNTMIVFEELGFTTPTFIPHGGSSEAYTSLIRGDADFTTGSGDSVAGYVDEGDVRAILTFSSTPLDLLPNAQIGADVGLEQYDDALATQLIVTAPPETDPAVLEVLRCAHTEVVEGQWMQDWAAEADRILVPRNAEETDQSLRNVQDLYTNNRAILEEYVE